MTANGREPAPATDVFAASRDHLVRTSSAMQRILGRNAYAVSGEGAEVTLSDGRRVIDFGSFAATLLGHRPPAVVAAVQHQLALLPGAAKGLAHRAGSRAGPPAGGAGSPRRASTACGWASTAATRSRPR